MLLAAIPCGLSAQSLYLPLHNPLDFPIVLAGNFGELRAGHFHSGIDIKTEHVQGKAVHAVADGYVARISVSPWNYGHSLYIVHPALGLTTVYGHLQRFAPRLAAWVKEQQYAQESFAVDLRPSPGQFPVRQGQLVAYSGNTGGSRAPHLHFEVRRTASNMPVDPLDYLKPLVRDTRPPRIDAFMVYPMPGKGAVNGGNRKAQLRFVSDKQGRHLNGSINAWGEIGLAVEAKDYMDGTSNIYGVKHIAMAVDSTVVFSCNIDSFSLDEETRYINSFTDFEEWVEHRRFFMKSFIDPGDRLNCLNALNRGLINIDQERDYKISYRLRDAFGNLTQYAFLIHGRRQRIAPVDTLGRELFHWKSDNRFGANGIRLSIPAGNLYEDLLFHYRYTPSEGPDLCGIHHLNDSPVALQLRDSRLALRLLRDSRNPSKAGIVRLNGRRASWIGGTYRNGWIEAPIRELGDYSIQADLKAPLIRPVRQAAWAKNRRIVIHISDDLSGIGSYRGEIDGKYALFEYDGKSGTVAYTFDRQQLKPGRHRLSFTLTDAVGNSSRFNWDFSSR